LLSLASFHSFLDKIVLDSRETNVLTARVLILHVDGVLLRSNVCLVQSLGLRKGSASELVNGHLGSPVQWRAHRVLNSITTAVVARWATKIADGAQAPENAS